MDATHKTDSRGAPFRAWLSRRYGGLIGDDSSFGGVKNNDTIITAYSETQAPKRAKIQTDLDTLIRSGLNGCEKRPEHNVTVISRVNEARQGVGGTVSLQITSGSFAHGRQIHRAKS